ncbi:MAG: hypothetical protein R3F11_03570 [Verrucomicrobiales bacterium]
MTSPKNFTLLAAAVAVVGSITAPSDANAALIAGVDFEGASPSTFDRTPDDLDLADGITVSSGGTTPVFDGWTLLLLDGTNGANGNLRNDAGANAACRDHLPTFPRG